MVFPGYFVHQWDLKMAIMIPTGYVSPASYEERVLLTREVGACSRRILFSHSPLSEDSNLAGMGSNVRSQRHTQHLLVAVSRSYCRSAFIHDRGSAPTLSHLSSV